MFLYCSHRTHHVDSNRKRPRSYREDEPVISEPRQILSDQSNVNEDIGPRPVVFSRHHASRRKISVKRSKVCSDLLELVITIFNYNFNVHIIL